ncbi:MAG: hemolysin III family protein [Clostridia bacterium]|nr:hemolysin III family protein [Clostridia bacterium]
MFLKRIKLVDRLLPAYTRGEEWFNAISHMVGGLFGIVALVWSVLYSALFSDGFALASSVVYGFSLVLLYTISSVYHALRPPLAKKVMQVLDHCAIYILIAGTYTPILLCRVRTQYSTQAWVLFGVIWGIALLAMTLNAIDLRAFRVFSMVCYIGMGWAIVFALKSVLATVEAAGFWWLLAGGIAYTIGAVLYGIGARKKWFHSVFHIFVVIGSVCHFVTIIAFVL